MFIPNVKWTMNEKKVSLLIHWGIVKQGAIEELDLPNVESLVPWKEKTNYTSVIPFTDWAGTAAVSDATRLKNKSILSLYP